MNVSILDFGALADGVTLNTAIKTGASDWRDTLNGVSRQFYSPAASDIAPQ